MYRAFLRQCLSRASSGAGHLQASGRCVATGVGSQCHMSKRVSLRQGVTFSQWRYMRNAYMNMTRTSTRQVHCSKRTLSVSTEIARKKPPESVNEVFERHHSLLVAGNFKPESFSNFATALCSAMYANLAWLPWLHSDNYIISYMQILMNGRTDDLLTEPLYKEKHFKELYDHLSANIDSIPGKDCPSILLCLLYSGLQQTDPLTLSLLDRCRGVAHELDVSQIRDTAHVLQSLGGRDFDLTQKLVSRLSEIFSQRPADISMEIIDLCMSNPVLAVYMSQDLLEKCVSTMLYKVEQQFPDLDINTIGCCFRYARKMSFRVDRDSLDKIKLLGKAALDALPDSAFASMQSHHIAEIGHNAKRLGCFTEPVVSKVQKRSLELLRDKTGGLRIHDITNLLFAFSRDTSPALRREIGQLLMQHMNDADVLTLSNIGDNLLELGINDRQVVRLYQWKVLQNFENITMFITRLVKVVRLLRERLECDPKFNQQASQVLLKQLEYRQGYDPTFVVTTAQFVLPTVRTIVPAVLMECLMKVIPRCNLGLMLMILSGLEKMKGPWSRSLHNQVLDIRSMIQENVGEKVENARNASELSQLVKGLHIKCQNRDFVLLDRMMSHYPQLTKSMNRHDYMRTVLVFKQLSHPYYHPQVFEDLIEFAKHNYKQINLGAVTDLVNVLANTAYRPEKFQEFAEFTTQALVDAMEEENYIGQLTLAYYLSIMQIFPDKVLGQIFTFDYLEEIDSIIEAEPDRRVFLKNLMMQLNRSVILECPHLDIPWFHNAYCQELAQQPGIKDFQKNLQFVDEVEAALQEVLRGLKYVGKNVYSPYYHAIDFEVVLDKAGEPVSAAAQKLLNTEELEYQRIAVMLIANQQLCANSTRRRGQYLKDKRHLELLGYRVEEVTRYDWNSMALADWGAKVNYVHKKVFRGTKKEQTPAAPVSPSLAESKAMHPMWK